MAAVPDIFKSSTLNGVHLDEVSIDDLQEYLRVGAFTSRDLTAFYLERIQRVNKYLHAITETNPDALEIASILDTERSHGISRGPLHGIPILVKDNIATADKMQTTSGSLALVGSIVPRDAHIVKLLRHSGAIIIGHSSMCEWASMRSSEESIGYSARGGQVRNPYNLAMSAWGSSSGSAVAVAAGMAPLSIATETDTSIIGPAGMCGLVGIKPTVGLTSRAGVIPISENQDTVGPHAVNVRDAVYGLQSIVGVDLRDPHTLPSSKHLEKDYTSFLADKYALQGAIFGIPMKRCWDNVDPSILPTCLTTLSHIISAGATIVEVDFPCWEDRISPKGWAWNEKPPTESEFHVCAIDFYNGLKAYCAELKNTSIRSVEDIIAFNEAHAALEGAHPGDHPAYPIGHNILREVAALKGARDDTYFQGLSYIRQKCRAEGIDAALRYTLPETGETIQLDALLLADRKCPGQQLAAQAGYPIITIPIGIDAVGEDGIGGRPFGLSFQQTAWGEGKLIRFASAVEDLLNGIKARSKPEYRNWEADNLPVIP